MSDTDTTKMTAPTPPVKTPAPSIEDVMKKVLELQQQVTKQQKVAAVVTPAAPKTPEAPKPIDWTKIDESNLYIADNIPLVPQEAPTDLNVHLKDKNYVPRWVNVSPKRMGKALAQGYTYVVQEDLDENFPMTILQNANGNYQDTDVVLMKIHKSRYYPALRRNYDVTQATRKVKGRIRQEVENNPRLSQAMNRGSLSVYEEDAHEEIMSATPVADLTL